MIDGDIRHDSHIGIDQVNGIQTAAQPDFQHNGIRFRFGKQSEGNQCRELEKSQRHIATCSLDDFKTSDKRFVIGHFPVNSYPFVETVDMRRCIQADTITGLFPDRLQHGTGRSLAVRSADDHDRTVEADTKTFLHDPDSFEPHVDIFGMHTFCKTRPFRQ